MAKIFRHLLCPQSITEVGALLKFFIIHGDILAAAKLETSVHKNSLCDRYEQRSMRSHFVSAYGDRPAASTVHA